MKKVALLVVGVVFVSMSSFAGEYLMNDTEETIYGLRIVFSEPVEITGFGDVLMAVEPAGESTEFVFFGGELGSWAGHWFNWEPVSASLVSHEWFTDPATVETATSDWAAYEASRPFWERNPNPTYEEIMAKIAEYPEPDEPLYVPADDEAIWLTDLEGHADIYDNDSIRINYAEWFDQSQITKSEVYRNSIRMRFLPDKLEILTNEQMKTFDGNPLENSPGSAHTDHTVSDYEFKLRVHMQNGTSHERSVTVKSRVKFGGGYVFASMLVTWFNPLTRSYRDWSWIELYLEAIRGDGIRGIQLDVCLYMDSSFSNEVFPVYDASSPQVHPWYTTAPDDVISRMIESVRSAGLEAELRIQLFLTQDYIEQHPGANRGALYPSDIELWRRNFTEYLLHYAALAETAGANYFCLMVENDSIYSDHPDVITSLLSDVDEVFSGELAVSESTNLYLQYGLFDYNTFWGYPDVVIGMNCWAVPFETRADQRLSTIVESIVQFWQPAVDHYREQFPGHKLVFAEIGHYNYDGALVVKGVPTISEADAVRDDQEMADFYAGVFLAAEALGLDGLCIWGYEMASPETKARWSGIDTSTSRLLVGAFTD